MVHAQKPDFVFRRNGRVLLNRRGESGQSTTCSRGVRISGSNAGYIMFRGSVKVTGYPLHSPVFPSFPLPCVTVCHHISTGLHLSWFKHNFIQRQWRRSPSLTVALYESQWPASRCGRFIPQHLLNKRLDDVQKPCRLWRQKSKPQPVNESRSRRLTQFLRITVYIWEVLFRVSKGTSTVLTHVFRRSPHFATEKSRNLTLIPHFQFITLSSPYHLTLYSLSCRQRR